MNFNIIVAYSKNMGIGYNNTILWKLKSDLKKFYKMTVGNKNNAIIMGKNTWLSIVNKPLKNRDNLILTNTLKIDNNQNVKTFNNIENIIKYCYNKNYDDVWIIGGEKVYKDFLNNYNNLIKYIYVTYLDNVYKCDTYFPYINYKIFNLISHQTHILDNEYNEYFDFKVWDRVYKNKNLNYSIS